MGRKRVSCEVNLGEKDRKWAVGRWKECPITEPKLFAAFGYGLQKFRRQEELQNPAELLSACGGELALYWNVGF